MSDSPRPHPSGIAVVAIFVVLILVCSAVCLTPFGLLWWAWPVVETVQVEMNEELLVGIVIGLLLGILLSSR